MRALTLRTIVSACLIVTASANAGQTAELSPESEAERLQEADEPLRPSVPGDFDPAANGLAARPLVVEDLGFAMYPPAGAVIVPQRTDGRFSLAIMDGMNPPSWSMSAQHLIGTTSSTTAAREIEAHIGALKEAERPHRILVNEPFTAGGSRGHTCYIEQTGPRGEAIVSGWIVLPIGESMYLVFSLTTVPERFESLRRVLDAAFSTLALRTAGEVAMRRVSRFDTARAFLASLTADRLQNIRPFERWMRIYRPSPSGDGEIEIGYSVLEIRAGKRGELNPDRDESSYSKSEHNEGLLVRLQGRLIDMERNIFFDSRSLYWIAWDQSEEAWDVKGTERQQHTLRTQAETGIRTAPSLGDPRPLLTVIRDSSATRQQSTNDWTVPDVYLSQAIAPLLGVLLPKDEPREFAWYFYNYSHATPQLTRRLDRWGPDEDQSGNWVLRSQLSVDSPVIRSTYSADGQFVRTVRVDGVVTEPTTPEQLMRIWEQKGLPLDTPRSRTGSRR